MEDFVKVIQIVILMKKKVYCKDIKDGFGYCACMEGYNRGGNNNKCIKYVNYNETCDLEHDLCGDINQFCWNGNKCTCRSMSIYSNETKKCEKILFYGEFCFLGGVCLGNRNLECSTVTSKCTCLNGSKYNEYFKKCQKTVNYEESCDYNYDICGEKLQCSHSNKCKCDDGYTYNSTEKFAKELQNLEIVVIINMMFVEKILNVIIKFVYVQKVMNIQISCSSA